jgi:hypothetical protein
MTTRPQLRPIAGGPDEFEEGVAYHHAPGEFDIAHRPVHVELTPVDKIMLLQAHAGYVRLRAFLKEHNFLSGPEDGNNPFLGESTTARRTACQTETRALGWSSSGPASLRRRCAMTRRSR